MNRFPNIAGCAIGLEAIKSAWKHQGACNFRIDAMNRVSTISGCAIGLEAIKSAWKHQGACTFGRDAIHRVWPPLFAGKSGMVIKHHGSICKTPHDHAIGPVAARRDESRLYHG